MNEHILWKGAEQRWNKFKAERENIGEFYNKNC